MGAANTAGLQGHLLRRGCDELEGRGHREPQGGAERIGEVVQNMMLGHAAWKAAVLPLNYARNWRSVLPRKL